MLSSLKGPFRIKRAQVYPDCNPLSADSYEKSKFDLAILELKERLQLSKTVKPIEITHSFVEGQLLYIHSVKSWLSLSRVSVKSQKSISKVPGKFPRSLSRVLVRSELSHSLVSIRRFHEGFDVRWRHRQDTGFMVQYKQAAVAPRIFCALLHHGASTLTVALSDINVLFI